MSYHVKLTRVSDGRSVEYDEDLTWSFFHWTEGNNGCDCNRELYFERQMGREAPDDELACSTGRYRVTITAEDGTLLLHECAPDHDRMLHNRWGE